MTLTAFALLLAMNILLGAVLGLFLGYLWGRLDEQKTSRAAIRPTPRGALKLETPEN